MKMNIPFLDLKSVNLIYIKSKNQIINLFCSKFMIFAQAYIIYYFNFINKNKYYFVYSSGGEFFSKFRTFQYIHMCIFSNNIFEYKNFGLDSIFKKVIRFLFVISSRFILTINKLASCSSNRLIKKRDSRQSDDISTIDIGRTNKKSIASNNIKTISVKKRQSDENNDDVTSLTKQEGIY